jgi:hypothetical protein
MMKHGDLSKCKTAWIVDVHQREGEPRNADPS